MTVPTTPTIEDWSFELVNLDASPITFTIMDHDLVNASGWNGRGASAHRAESFELEIMAQKNGTQTQTAAALDWDATMAVRIVPYEDATREFWGYILKGKQIYSDNGEQDRISLQCVPIEYLLHSRLVYYKANAGSTAVAIAASATAADDFLKDLVTQCTSGVDPKGVSRAWNWGTLAIEADESAATAITLTEFGGQLDEVLDGIAKANDVDWELKPSVSAGAVTFTFNTVLTRSGADKTTGDSRVVIDEFGGMLPSGERFYDFENTGTVLHAIGMADSYTDATAYTARGRWELQGKSTAVDDAMKADLSRGTPKEGQTVKLNMAMCTQCRWMAEWDIGDLVVYQHTTLGQAEANEEINGVHWSFPERALDLEIRFGNKEPTREDKQGGGRHKPPLDPVMIVHNVLSEMHYDSLAASVVRGDVIVGNSTPKWSRLAIGAATSVLYSNGTDASWKILEASDLPITGLESARFYGTLGAGTYTTFDPDNDFQIGFLDGTGASVTVGDHTLTVNTVWKRDATGTAFLTQTTAGDELRIKNGSDADMFYVDTSGNVGGLTSGSFLALDFHGYDFKNLAGTGNGLHDLWMSGDIISDTASSGSKIEWVADGDAVYARTLYVDSDATLASHTITMVGASGNTTWAAAAQMSWEGVAYRMPTSVGTTGQVLTLTTGTPNQLSWAAAASSCEWSDDGSTRLTTTDAGRYVQATRFEVGAATEYLSNISGTLFADASVSHNWAIGGTAVVVLGTASFNPSSAYDDVLTCGSSTRRFGNVYSVLGNFEGQVTISVATGTAPLAVTSTTACTNLNADMLEDYHGSFNADAYTVAIRGAGGALAVGALTCSSVIVSGNVDGVDISAFKSAYDSHEHAYNKVVGYHAAGYDGDVTTSSFSVTGSPDYTGLPLRLTSGTQIYLSTSAYSTSADVTHVQVGVGTQTHVHSVSYDSDNSGTPV